MNRTKTLVIALWAVFVTQTTFSQKGSEEQLTKDANAYFTSGEYLKAFPLFSQLVSLYPNHPDYNYKFGACAIFSEQDKSKAVRYLTIATAKGVEDKMAWYYLGKAYHLNYQFKEAIRSYENFLRNADPKVAMKTDAQREIETCIYGSGLLSNIKDISVISKTEADKANFFRYFNLEAIGGQILTIPDALKSKMDFKSKEPGIIHYPGNSTTIYYSSFGKDGSTGKDIYKAQILPDGKFSAPVKLSGDVNTKYDEDYCFMHSDGKTLFFASRGHNSMGGYDIFKSVYDTKTMTFGPAINLDFAINTPDDDIFYITDSLNQKAYFASGRASDLDHLNVYNVMVESTQLQIVYIKGEYISEINPDQKKAGIKVMDTGSGRMVCDGISGGANGNYLLYVPKSGEYHFKVITENSPVVHDVKVTVPPFNEPVAIRQEMRLVSENGQDKLIVNNFFEKLLEEDLSTLAAEMLRKKSNLDVNVAIDAVVAKTESKTKSDDGVLMTFEKTMVNAPIAAGFANGITIVNIVEGMQQEASKINRFVDESDAKYENSLSYASKKYQEAETSMSEAESIRKNLGTISTDEDILKLRKSVELADNAENLQIEAKAAMNAAESIQQYKVSEKDRVTQLQAQIAELQSAEVSGNYDMATKALTIEKDRQTMMRDGNGNGPIDELGSKVKARQSEQSREEQKLQDLRDSENALLQQTNSAEAKLSAAKKEKDKQAASNELAEFRSQLDNTRKNISLQLLKVEKSGNEAKMAHANVSYFSNISENTSFGLQEKDKLKLSETDKAKLGMRLDEMKNRLAALEITDPQMLAMVTEGSSENKSDVAHSSAVNSETKTISTPTVPTNSVKLDKTSATDDVNQTASTVPSKLRSKNTDLIAKTGDQSTLAPARRMILSQTLHETDDAIKLLETKKKDGVFAESDNAALTELIAFRSEIKADINANGSEPVALSPEALRMVYTEVSSDYNDQTQFITNSKGTEIDRTAKMMNYKKATLDKLKAARLSNSQMASNADDIKTISAFAIKDQQYESAIATLTNETHDVNQLKAAYETENKSIIESDAVFAEKLQDQISATESYLDALGIMESFTQKELDNTFDTENRTILNEQLIATKSEEEIAFKKLETYRRDIQLTASVDDPKDDALGSNSALTLEDMMENNSDANLPNEPEEKDEVAEDAVKIERIFKRHEESESIFAYESSSFEEIIAHHQSEDLQLKNREKIREFNDQIFLIEAEMENEESPAKLRKLDYKAEQLYLRRSLIEIDNAGSIAKMTRLEYDQELAKANELVGLNTDKIEGTVTVRDEIKRLKREANVNMNNAREIREKAPAIQDDIERADYYRQAFAKEALAIDNLHQIEAICENLDMILHYSEQDLAQLRSGKIPSDKLASNMTSMQAAGGTAIVSDNTATKSEVVEMSPSEEESGSRNQVLNFSTDSSGSIVTDKKTVVADEAGVVNMTMAVDEAEINLNEIANSISELKSTPSNISRKNESISEVSASEPKATTISNTAPSAAKSLSAASASSANAEDYYYSMPEFLSGDLFKRTNRAVYSENKPIPVDMTMPKGVYYKVQVGAFRNDIPQNLYDEFAPVCGERLASGITRYTAGFFVQFESADKVKMEIRTIGYSDAFVVAFRDGKRIPLYEAMSKTDGAEFTAAVEKEYVYGDKGEAPKVAKSTSTTSEVVKPLVTDYYKATANTVKATQVETLKGLFFTVQVGVYSKPVSAKSIYNIKDMNSELTETKKIRYTAGRFTSMMAAVEKRSEAKGLGINDAFITAYWNGRRISLSEADRLLKEKGADILLK